MTVIRLADTAEIHVAVKRLRDGDVVACGDWRLTLAADGGGVWIERRGQLWLVPRRKGYTARVRAVVEEGNSGGANPLE